MWKRRAYILLPHPTHACTICINWPLCCTKEGHHVTDGQVSRGQQNQASDCQPTPHWADLLHEGTTHNWLGFSQPEGEEVFVAANDCLQQLLWAVRAALPQSPNKARNWISQGRKKRGEVPNHIQKCKTGSLEEGSDLGICAAAWDHAWLSLRLLSETLKTNSYFFKTRHLFHFSSIGVFLKNAYACLTLGNLFLEFGFASVLRAFFCLFGIFKEDFVLTKYPRLTAPGNKSSDRAECLCHPWQGKYPALSPLCFPSWATISSRTADKQFSGGANHCFTSVNQFKSEK